MVKRQLFETIPAIDADRRALAEQLVAGSGHHGRRRQQAPGGENRDRDPSTLRRSCCTLLPSHPAPWRPVPSARCRSSAPRSAVPPRCSRAAPAIRSSRRPVRSPPRSFPASPARFSIGAQCTPIMVLNTSSTARSRNSSNRSTSIFFAAPEDSAIPLLPAMDSFAPFFFAGRGIVPGPPSRCPVQYLDPSGAQSLRIDFPPLPRPAVTPGPAAAEPAPAPDRA